MAITVNILRPDTVYVGMNDAYVLTDGVGCIIVKDTGATIDLGDPSIFKNKTIDIQFADGLDVEFDGIYKPLYKDNNVTIPATDVEPSTMAILVKSSERSAGWKWEVVSFSSVGGGGGGADEINIGTTAVNNGNDKSIFFNDNGILREIPGFTYDKNAPMLNYTDGNGNMISAGVVVGMVNAVGFGQSTPTHVFVSSAGIDSSDEAKATFAYTKIVSGSTKFHGLSITDEGNISLTNYDGEGVVIGETDLYLTADGDIVSNKEISDIDSGDNKSLVTKEYLQKRGAFELAFAATAYDTLDDPIEQIVFTTFYCLGIGLFLQTAGSTDTKVKVKVNGIVIGSEITIAKSKRGGVIDLNPAILIYVSSIISVEITQKGSGAKGLQVILGGLRNN